MDNNNEICATFNINLDKSIFSKHRTVCKSCYNKNRRRNNDNNIFQNEIITSRQQPKVEKINKNNVNNAIVPANENHPHIVFGLRNVGKTYYMLKILEKKR